MVRKGVIVCGSHLLHSIVFYEETKIVFLLLQLDFFVRKFLFILLEVDVVITLCVD